MKRIILMTVLLMAALPSCSNSVVGRYDLISETNHDDISFYDYNYVELKADGTFLWKESSYGSVSEISGTWFLNGTALIVSVPRKIPAQGTLVDGVLVIQKYTFSKKGKSKVKESAANSHDADTPASSSNADTPASSSNADSPASSSNADTPASIEKRINAQFQKGDFEKGMELYFANLDAAETYSPEEAKIYIQWGAEKKKDFFEARGGLESYEVIEEIIAEDGKSAKVTGKFTCGYGYELEGETQYVKKDGAWKIVDQE